MIEVVSIKFKNRGKCYFFSPNGLDVHTGDRVIVETAKGLEIADCTHGNHKVADTAVVQPLRAVQRIATEDDLRIAALNAQREKEAFTICQEKIAKHGLDMKLVDVECNFEGTKTMFFFTSDGRVDFRELVKDLAGIFRNRIELRQIGVRDEAKMIGGIGICGRPYCCSQFLDDFQPVSTKMAKVQALSLNPAKISGSCGRLMCCLRYEQEAYEDLIRKVPKQGAFVETRDGFGTAVQVNLLRQTVKVRLDGEGDDTLHLYKSNELCAVPGGRPRDGEAPVSTFRYVPESEQAQEEPEVNPWFPQAQFNDPALLDPPAEPAGEEPRKPARRRRGKKPRPEAKPETRGEPKSEPKSETRRESRREAKSETRPETRREAKPEPGGVARAEDKAAGKDGRSGRTHRGGKGRGKPNRVEVKAHSGEAAPRQAEAPKKETAAPQPAPQPAREEAARPRPSRRRTYRGKPKPKGGEE